MTGTATAGDDGLVRCDACPVLCRIRPGKAGACDRYANRDGVLVRLDPLVVTERAVGRDGALVPFLDAAADWDGKLVAEPPVFSQTTTLADCRTASESTASITIFWPNP